MATLNIGGQRVKVDDSFLQMSPEQQGAAVEEIAGSLKSQPSMASDAAKSFGVGVVEGVIGMAGVGDVRELASKATDFVGQKVGASPESVQRFKNVAHRVAGSNPFTSLLARAPTSGELREKVEGVTGEFYEPQTMAGEYARTVGQFAPAAVAGPGGIIRRGAQAVIPAVASETAGQATKGTEHEPYARVAGALAGGIAAAGRAPAPQRVTAADLKAEAQAAYRDPAVTGLVVDPAGPRRLADSAVRTMERQGARPFNAGETYRTVDELRDLPATQAAQAMKSAGLNPGATVDDIKSVRTALGETIRSGTDPLTGSLNTSANAARAAREKITDYLANIPAHDVIRGDAKKAAEVLKRANDNYAASKRMGIVEALTKRAELQAGSANSGQNVNNATRQQLKKLLQDTRKSKGFSKEEMAQLDRAVLGTRTGNAARFVGNALAPSGAMLFQNSASAAALGGLAAYGAGNDPTTAAIATGILSQVAGRGARRIGNKSTARQTRKFEDMVAARSPHGSVAIPQRGAQSRQSIAQARREALLAALAGSQVSNRQHLLGERTN